MHVRSHLASIEDAAQEIASWQGEMRFRTLAPKQTTSEREITSTRESQRETTHPELKYDCVV
ncbi:hypothetical protein D3C86_806600 [compost metagenome]